MAERCAVCGKNDAFAGGRCGVCGAASASSHTSEPTVMAVPVGGDSGSSSAPTMVGAPAKDGTGRNTFASPAHPSSSKTSAGNTSSRSGSGRSDEQMAPGTVLAGRYRVVAPLGRGGMGLVYRAEDLRLGETVALKFLPPSLANDPVWLERFYVEVRTAREVTHPNVCRVHDLVEVRAEHGHELRFLTMEYVDGENLADLLRRFGRLPTDKAMELAGQITAALAAAHSKGVLHRDIKPANVMIDGRGQAKLADFGLAIAAESASGTEVAGTPGYIAPELLRGAQASGRSDLYALGLVLYELLTGQRAVKDGKVVTGSVRQYAPEISADAERAVLQCLEPEPAKRPVSAAQMLAAFPAKNLLEAVIARGETPSPEMVADSADETPMQLWKAWALLGLVAVVLLLTWAVAGQGGFYSVKPPQLSPEEMRGRAQQYLREFGYPTKGVVQYMALDGNFAVLDWYSQQGTPEQKRAFATSPQGSILALYQQSQGTNLLPEDGVGGTAFRGVRPGSRDVTGSELAVVDSDGNLVGMGANPAGEPALKPATMDWAEVLKKTGVDPASVTETKADFVPRYAFDERRSWTAWYPGHPDFKLSIEAASWRGHLNYLRVSGPWNQQAALLTARMGPIAWNIAGAAGLAVGLVLAIYNLRRKRGDVRSATRLAVFFIVISVMAFLFYVQLSSHYLQDYLTAFLTWLGIVLREAALIWLAYIAVEPLTRKKIPQLLVASSLILQGRWRSVRVGREILTGALVGAAVELWFQTAHALQWGRWPGATLDITPAHVLGGVREYLGSWFLLGGGALIQAAQLTVLLTLLLVIVRNRLVAMCFLGALIIAIADVRGSVLTALMVVGGLALGAGYLYLRVGLVAVVASYFASNTSDSSAWTHDFSSWTLPETLWSMVIVLAIAAFGFWLAIGGQKPLGNLALEE
jgi:Protein kinase domain